LRCFFNQVALSESRRVIVFVALEVALQGAAGRSGGLHPGRSSLRLQDHPSHDKSLPQEMCIPFHSHLAPLPAQQKKARAMPPNNHTMLPAHDTDTAYQEHKQEHKLFARTHAQPQRLNRLPW
jgi:hypothetical protein